MLYGQQTPSALGMNSGGLHLATLAAFAISQPLLDLIRQHPSFLSALRAGPGQILALVLVLSLAIPGLFFALARLGRCLPRQGQRIWLATWTGLLSSLIALPIGLHRLKPSTLGGETAILVAACAVGLAMAWGTTQWPTARQFLTFLAPAILIFPTAFLSSSSIRKLILPPPPLELQRIANLPAIPIIIVVFDEFPLTSLLGEDHLIDRVRFPNFAALAESSTWYPNATSVEIETVRALPAILTGRTAPLDRKQAATYAEFPDNLFTWLGGTAELRVTETYTNLCPAQLCEAPDPGLEPSSSDEFSFGGMMEDLGLVYLHFVLPPSWTHGLPNLEGRWGGFWQGGRRSQAEPGSGLAVVSGRRWRIRRAETFQDFVDHLQPIDQRARLYFHHSLLPHTPWEYLPDLSRYNDPLQMPGCGQTEPITWHPDPFYSQAAYVRLRLQIQATDRLLGRLMDRLKELEMWDPAIVLITADHGLSFIPGENIRGYFNREALLTELLPIPLFLKTPNQTAGLVDNRLAENLDLLPTLADLLGVPVPWETEGYSLLADRQRAAERASINRIFGFSVSSREELTKAKYEDLDQKLAQAEGREGPGLWKDGYTSWKANLLGKKLKTLKIESGPAGTVVLSRPELFQSVDLSSGVVPAHIIGDFRQPEGVETPQDTHFFLAVAVNGIICGIARTEEPEERNFPFSTIVPSAAFVSGPNTVEILKVTEKTAGGISLIATNMTDTQAFAKHRFETSDGPLLTIGPSTGFAGVEALQLVEIDTLRGGPALGLNAVGMDPALLLPHVAMGNATTIHLAIGLTVPQATEVRVFYQTEAKKIFWWGNSVSQPIAAGRSTIFIELFSQEGFLGPIRIDPGKHPGRYLLHSIEIRD